MAPITTLETMIVAVIPLLEMHHSGAQSESTPGTRAVSTIAFWTIHVLRTWSVSRKLQVPPSCLMRILKGLSSGNTSIWATSVLFIQSVVGKNGFSYAQSFGMGRSSLWSLLIARHGMRSFKLYLLHV
jgi:hypothetical protein